GADLAGRATGDVGVAEEVCVSQLRALRLAGRTGGVEDDRGVVLGRVGELRSGALSLVYRGQRRTGSREQGGERGGLDLDELRAGISGSLSRFFGEPVPGEQQLCPRVLQVE